MSGILPVLFDSRTVLIAEGERVSHGLSNAVFFAEARSTSTERRRMTVRFVFGLHSSWM